MPPHRPVLYQETLQALKPMSGATYIDCTLGAGGHSIGILEASSPSGRLLGMDVDPTAIEIARQRLASFGDRVMLFRKPYLQLTRVAEQTGWKPIMGVLMDLGVSSMQLDDPGRGFSFRVEAPLDMRFDPDNPVTAQDLVNHLTETELADLIYQYGEERRSRKIAREIIRNRPISGTAQLAQVVTKAVRSRSNSKKRRQRHPATRTFQALRIAVNNELDGLEKVLPLALDILEIGGRLAVISFHSLEDRIVKIYFRRESEDCICPPETPQCLCGHRAAVHLVTRRPIKPSQEEILHNPRARSARLRVVEKIGHLAH